MKTLIASVLIVTSLAGTAFCGDNGTFNAAPPKLPVTAKVPDVYGIVPKALSCLDSSANKDGSWATDVQSFQATSLALSAFIRHGETTQSPKYGTLVAKAHAWLLASHPETTEDKLAVVRALSDYYTLHRTPETAAKVDTLLQGIDEANGAWRDILCMTRLPDETKRPGWAQFDAALQKKYVDQKNDYVLDSHDAYLSMYVAGLVKHNTGGNTWAKHHKTRTPVILAAQRPDGAFSTKDAKETATATALASLSVLVMHHGSSQFSAQTKVRKKVDNTVQQAVEADATK